MGIRAAVAFALLSWRPGNRRLEGYDPAHRLRVSFVNVHATNDIQTRSRDIDTTGRPAMDGNLEGCAAKFGAAR